MAQLPVRDSLADLERHRLRLEENMEKLRKALRHWQTWEAEYEGLKEEIQALPSKATEEDLRRVGKDFEGDLVTEKEVVELLGIDKGNKRTGKQIVDLVSRRIDYVQRNVASLQKQLDEAQFKLDGIDTISEPDARNEEGLPITEIYEELDEDGNIISSRTSHPDDAKPQILEALKRVGVKDEDILSTSTGSQNGHVEQPSAPSTNFTDHETLSPARKKSVSFAEGTKEEASDPAPSTAPSHLVQPSPREERLAELAKGSFGKDERVIELDDDDMPIASITPQAPIDESPEDAALRRQMQAYGMREVGEIVAQLDLLDEESQTSSYDEDEDDEFGLEPDSDDEGEYENEYGMDATGKMSEEYKQEMLELENKLNARMIQNIGPDPNLNGNDEVAAAAKRLVVQRERPLDAAGDNNHTAQEQIRSKEKSVRFAESLDIAPHPDPTTRPEAEPRVTQTLTPAVKDVVTERKPSKTPSEEHTRPASRFKKARQESETPDGTVETVLPHRSSSNPLAADIIERSPRHSKPPPNEFDPEVVRQELNSEYYRQRNRIIQRQGGFKRHMQEQDDDDDDDDDAGDDGGNEDVASAPERKISLFKAARTHGL